MLKKGGNIMGYFLNLKIDYDEDDSYPSPDRQLMWRLEDLQSRLEELQENGEPPRYKDDGLRLTDDDIRYAIPEYFMRIADVERAIDLTISDLRFKYNIEDVEENIDEEQNICDVQLPTQLCFDELVLVEPYDKPLKAA